MGTTSTGVRSVDSQSTCFGRLLRPLYQKRKVTLASLGKNQSGSLAAVDLILDSTTEGL
jgi:hypothetical protein